MLSRSDLERYSQTNKALAEAAATDFMKFWQLLDKTDPGIAYEEALAYAEYLIEHYGESAALNASELYEATNDVSNAAVSGSVKRPELERAIRFLVYEGTAQAAYAVRNMLKKQVKSYAHETMMDNSRSDGIRFARVPVGETCAFCLMLASRGFEYYSEESAGKGSLNAFHDDCDCEIIGSDQKIEGYDPDYLYKEIYKPAYDEAKRIQGEEIGTLSDIQKKYGYDSEEARNYAESIDIEYYIDRRGRLKTRYKRRKRRSVNLWYDPSGHAPTRSYEINDHVGRTALAIMREKNNIS